jgi:protein SCO1/2
LKRLWLILLLALLLGCSPKPASFVATDVTGADFASGFTLTSPTGKAVQLTDFKGKAVVVFFGYTRCPDICPTTMNDLAKAMKILGDDANRVQVIFITLDPERDSAELLQQFVPAFDARFIGLTGTPQQIQQVTQTYKIFVQKQADKQQQYTIDHSAGAYVYEPSGKLRLYFKYGQSAEDMAHDLQLLLAQSKPA